MVKQSKFKNIFADKASLIARKMIENPDKKWIVRDFIGKYGVSIGMAQEIFDALEWKGYIERIRKGPHSYSILTNREKLIQDWLDNYKFDHNAIDLYFSSDKNIIKKIKNNINNKKYALTLHTGANYFTSYVKTENIYFYLNSKTWDKDLLEIREKLDLKELIRGGNIYIIKPYYKNSIFINSQLIKGYSVVSSLQLYLDLYNFQPRGREHAEYLKSILREKGIYIA